MKSLHEQLNHLAAGFASSVLQALRGASIDELSGVLGGRAPATNGSRRNTRVASSGTGTGRRGGGGGRLQRRSASDIKAVVDKIVGLLGRHPKGLRAEEIRSELGLRSKELPRPIAEALGAKRIRKQGEKRATTYFARG
jgi:hypothetical protein